MGSKGSDQKKSGGSKKIGRNKGKCERYRFTKASGASVTGNKKPKGMRAKRQGRTGGSRTGGYIDDMARIPEERQTAFTPTNPCPHLCTEILANKTVSRFGSSRPAAIAEELARHIKPSLRHRVLTVPKQPEKPLVKGKLVESRLRKAKRELA